jgi:signal transduction histidine kinase
MAARETAPHSRTIVLAFLVVVTSFVSSTLYADASVRAIEEHTRSMRDSMAPRLHHLSRARTELRHLEVVIDRLADTSDTDVVRGSAEIAITRGRYVAAVDAYDALTAQAEEKQAIGAVRAHLGRIDGAAERALARLARSEADLARAIVETDVREATDDADDVLANLAERNAGAIAQLTTAIEDVRARASRIAIALDAVAALVAMGAVALALHVFRRHERLVETHERILEQRAAELETFSGRVAHDIVSPLSAASYALKFVQRSVPEGSAADEMTGRGQRALGRVRSIVDALLDFARSGAPPEKVAYTKVRPVMEGIADEARLMPEAIGFRIEVESFDDVEVACGQGVLTSVLSNLLNNAIRYSDDSAVREVRMRAQRRGDTVRCELEDRGPGLTPGMEERIFLPHVRGDSARQAGIGLGLATVKRLVEAHGGRVGVRSILGAGSVFWFELPRRPAAAAAATMVNARG